MQISQVDAFTRAPFAGNPAAVCFLTRTRSDGWMQALAREMNLSETAFVQRRADAEFDLRWFTPTVEVDLCGHATLATAHVVWEQELLPVTAAARFHTRSGLLTATTSDDGITLDFPAEPDEVVDAPGGLVEALGVEPTYLGRNRFDYLVELRDETTVKAVSPDFRRLAALRTRGVIVTARSDAPEYDFVSRFFAPGAGVDEDPVTGSAHCCLGPYWQRRLGRDTFTARQVSPRGGVVGVRVASDRVFLSGQAVTVFTAELTADALTEP